MDRRKPMLKTVLALSCEAAPQSGLTVDLIPNGQGLTSLSGFPFPLKKSYPWRMMKRG